MKPKTEVGIVAGLAGLISGGIIGLMLGAILENPTRVRTFREENRPAAMRIYSSGEDDIFVEISKDNYLNLESYLRGIENKAEREIEAAKIYKQVKWYEE